MPPKKGKAEKKEPPAKTSGVLTRSQALEVASVAERTRKRKASLGLEEKKPPNEWPDPPDTRRGKRARVDNAEAPEVVVEEANPVEEEVPKSGEGEAAKSGEEEGLAAMSGEGQASSSKGKGKGIQQDEGQKKKKRTMLIKHCKHSGDLFKARAAELKAALQFLGWNVRTDTKIRKGSFEAREVGGAAIIQLMDMEEPYQELVNLDVHGTVSAAVAL